jgi:hypothetical protein
VSQVRPHAEFDMVAPAEAAGEESRAQLRRLAPPALTAPRPASSRLDIVDNGCGIAADDQRRSGPANLCRRAERVGGRRCITSPPNCGTRVHWTAALVES